MKTNPKGFSNIIVIVLILGAVVIVGGGVYWVVSQQSRTNQNTNTANVNTTVNPVNQNLNTAANQNSNENTNAASNQNMNSVANQNANTPINQNTNTSSNTNSDPTADWKTYRNEKYKYEVKYPNDWLGSEDSATTDYATFSREVGDFMKSTFGIQIFQNDKSSDPQLWWAEYDKKDSTEYSYVGTVTMTGDGSVYQYKEQGGLEGLYSVFSNGSNIFLISRNGFSDEIFNTFLKSFKFVE